MSRVYVGNLPIDVRERELDDIFSRYGSISSIDIKGGRYVFVHGCRRFGRRCCNAELSVNSRCDLAQGGDHEIRFFRV